MRIRQLAFGLATYIPGVARLVYGRSTGPASARYNYSVWLRHLVMAYENGLCPTPPRVVVELGPGSSFGVGLAALLSGADKYYALDAVRLGSSQRNREIFEELVELFRSRERIPDESEFPRVKPALRSFDFPGQLLHDGLLRKTLDEGRLDSIRASLRDVGTSGMITYAAPWTSGSLVPSGTADMVLSQSVLECVDDLADAYQMMFTWLRPGGFVSHEIDLSSIGMADTWDGHWAYSRFAWGVLRGRRPYLLNRHPHSTHVGLLAKAGFTLVGDVRACAEPALNREQLARPFRELGTEDLRTRAVFLQAVKGGN